MPSLTNRELRKEIVRKRENNSCRPCGPFQKPQQRIARQFKTERRKQTFDIHNKLGLEKTDHKKREKSRSGRYRQFREPVQKSARQFRTAVVKHAFDVHNKVGPDKTDPEKQRKKLL